MDELLTQQEVGRLLRQSIKTLARGRQENGPNSGWVAFGPGLALPYIRLGKKIMFRKTDVEAFLNTGRTVPVSEIPKWDCHDEI